MGQPGLGALVQALITIGFATVTLGGVLYQHEIAAVARRAHRRVSPAPDPPAGAPIERIASDVRRLHAEFRAPPAGLPMARRIAISRAYDDLLVDACRALDVLDTLAGASSGDGA